MTYSSNRSLGFLFNRTANRLKAELEIVFAAQGFDVTSEQWAVLSQLCEEDGLAQNEIASRIYKDKTNVARMLALMEDHRLVERRVNSQDNRIREIYVTAHGRATYEKLLPLVQDILQRARQGLDDGRIEELIASINTIYNNLSG